MNKKPCLKNTVNSPFSVGLSNTNEWLNASEAANYLKVSTAEIYNMCSANQLQYYKLGRRNRFLKKDLDNLFIKKPSN